MFRSTRPIEWSEWEEAVWEKTSFTKYFNYLKFTENVFFFRSKRFFPEPSESKLITHCLITPKYYVFSTKTDIQIYNLANHRSQKVDADTHSRLPLPIRSHHSFFNGCTVSLWSWTVVYLTFTYSGTFMLFPVFCCSVNCCPEWTSLCLPRAQCRCPCRAGPCGAHSQDCGSVFCFPNSSFPEAV